MRMKQQLFVLTFVLVSTHWNLGQTLKQKQVNMPYLNQPFVHWVKELLPHWNHYWYGMKKQNAEEKILL